MTMIMIGLSVAYTVLRLIRICPAIRAPPDTAEFFKLFCYSNRLLTYPLCYSNHLQFCYQFHSKHPSKNPRKNFLEIWGYKL